MLCHGTMTALKRLFAESCQLSADKLSMRCRCFWGPPLNVDEGENTKTEPSWRPKLCHLLNKNWGLRAYESVIDTAMPQVQQVIRGAIFQANRIVALPTIIRLVINITNNPNLHSSCCSSTAFNDHNGDCHSRNKQSQWAFTFATSLQGPVLFSASLAMFAFLSYFIRFCQSSLFSSIHCHLESCFLTT